MKFIFVLTWLLGLVTLIKCSNSDEEDADLTTPQLIVKYGYPAETYNVTTEDGYILEVHRIPHGRNDSNLQNRPVMFLFHGLLCSSTDWIINGPNKSLGYIAADQGFDVWIGNARGNTYSRRHISLSPNDPKFWEYSFHEHGVYDLPAMIDLALNVSGQKKLFYVGHSQGTTAFFAMCSEKPKYCQKIAASFSLAPVAYMKYFKNPILRVAAFNRVRIEPVFKFLNLNEFLPSSRFLTGLSSTFCSKETTTQDYCLHFLSMAWGYDFKGLDKDRLPIILAHLPAGGSVKELKHLGQLIGTDGFTKYDYGPQNMEVYKSDFPPEYNMKNVTAPVALYYGQNDLLASGRDSKKIYDNLPNPIGLFKVEEELFNHGDFLWGEKAADLVYFQMLELAKKYK